MKTTLLAKSSHGEPYKVEFLATDSGLRIFCHCQAGVLQRMCKHKLALINADTGMLFDPKQAAVLVEIQACPQFADLKKRTEEYEQALRRLEAAKRELAVEEKEIKARYSHGLAHGF